VCKLTNNKQITNNRQHRIGSHEEQPLLFSLVYLTLYWAVLYKRLSKEYNHTRGTAPMIGMMAAVVIAITALRGESPK